MLRFLKTTALAGLPFGLCMGVFFGAMLQLVHPLPLAHPTGMLTGLAVGLASGLLFGLLLAGFVESQRASFMQEDPCANGERLLKQGAANHFRGAEAVGGWLALTDRRLLFRSHGFNIQTHRLSIPLRELVAVEACTTCWIIPNGLRVVTAEGIDQFVVEERRNWVQEIRKAAGVA
jgi:hypothetical protein